MRKIDIFLKNELKDSYDEISSLLVQHLKSLLLRITGEDTAFIRKDILKNTLGQNGEVKTYGDVPLYNQLVEQAVNNSAWRNRRKLYHPKMVLNEDGLCALFEIQPRTHIEEAEIDSISIAFQTVLNYMDFPGVCKALIRTQLSNLCKINGFIQEYQKHYNTIHDLFEKCLDIRAAIDAHKYDARPPEEVLAKLEGLRDQLKDSETETAFLEFYANGRAAVQILSELHSDLTVLVDDIHLYLEGYTIDQNSTLPLDAIHLRSYEVVTDEWALVSKYNLFLLDDVLDYWHLNVFDSSLDFVKDVYNNENAPQEYRFSCKNVLRKLKKIHSENGDHLIIRKDFLNNDGIPCDTEDNILTLLEKAPDRRFCIILSGESKLLAEKIIQKGNPNHVVLKIRDIKSAEPYTAAQAVPDTPAPAITFQFVGEDDVPFETEENDFVSEDSNPGSEPISVLEVGASAIDHLPDHSALPVMRAPEPDPITPAQTRSAPISPSVPGTVPAAPVAKKPAPVAHVSSWASDPLPEQSEYEDYRAPVYIPGSGDGVFRTKSCSGNAIELAEELGGGAEGTIYAVKLLKRKAVKIYKESYLTDARLKKLEAMQYFYQKKHAREKDAAKQFERICWPSELIYNIDGQLVGYMMERASDAYTLEGILTTVQAQGELPDNYPIQNRSDLVLICERIAERFDRLHALDSSAEPLLMGDVNPKNILIDKTKNVWFVDVDSYQFRRFPCPVGRQEFFSKRLSKKLGGNQSLQEVSRTSGDEKAALATLIFYTLFLREFPYNASKGRSYREGIENREFIFRNPKDPKTRHSYIWQNLSVDLQDLFCQAFGGSRGKSWSYPEPNDWIDPLHKQLKTILDDKQSSNEFYPTAKLLGEDDRFEIVTCRFCENPFEISIKELERSKERDYSNETELCPMCKSARSYFQTLIRARICDTCGKPFTVSEWDDAERSYCPDCDVGFRYSRYYEFNGTGSRDSEEFRNNLRDKLAAALENFYASKEEL